MSIPANDPKRVPIYLTASSRDNLILLMEATNQLNYRSFNYMQPVKEGDEYVVWFYGNRERDIIVTEDQLDQIPSEIGLLDIKPSNNVEGV